MSEELSVTLAKAKSITCVLLTPLFLILKFFTNLKLNQLIGNLPLRYYFLSQNY